MFYYSRTEKRKSFSESFSSFLVQKLTLKFEKYPCLFVWEGAWQSDSSSYDVFCQFLCRFSFIPENKQYFFDMFWTLMLFLNCSTRQKKLWVSSLKGKNLLNFISLTMKFHNRHHANIQSGIPRNPLPFCCLSQTWMFICLLHTLPPWIIFPNW